VPPRPGLALGGGALATRGDLCAAAMLHDQINDIAQALEEVNGEPGPAEP
jgi:hypothetical protein